MQGEVQLHSVSLAVASRSVKRPGHARKGGPDRAVVRHPLANRLGFPLHRSAVEGANFLRKTFENSLQNGGIDEVLGFGETREADGIGADLAPDLWQARSERKSPERVGHGVKQSEEHEAKIVAHVQKAAGVLEAGVRNPT